MSISEVAEPALMTAAEAAAKLRVTPWFVTERCRSGEIRATKPARTWLILPADLDAFIARHFNDADDVA